MKKFRIELDNPSKSYFPGETVSGKVVLTDTKETKTKGLHIEFSGIVKVEFSQRVGNSSRTYSEEEQLFYESFFPVGNGINGTEIIIPPGQNEYSFKFPIPNRALPPSFHSAFYGSIIYGVKATIKKSWAFDQTAQIEFTLNSGVNLSNHPMAGKPILKEAYENICCLCCTSGQVGFRIQAERQGYLPGEIITANAELINQSGRRIYGGSLSLIKEIKYFAQGEFQDDVESLVEAVTDMNVNPGQCLVWEASLEIPNKPLYPSGLGFCRLIEFNYYLKRTIPIIIGTTRSSTHVTFGQDSDDIGEHGATPTATNYSMFRVSQ